MTPDSGQKVETIQTVSGKEQVRDQDKIQLVLSYLGIFALIPLLTVKDSAFVQWHAKQGLSVLAVLFGLGIVGMVLAFVPVLGHIVGCVLWLADVAILVINFVAMVKALGGERWEIPLIGQIAKKF